MGDGVGDPLDQRLGGTGKVAYRGGVDGEKVGEAVAGHSHVGAGAVGEFLFEDLAADALDVNQVEGAGYGVVAGGEDEDVQLVRVAALQLEAAGVQAGDGVFAHVHQQDVVPVIHLVVAGLAGQTLGAEHMILGHQHFGHFGVVDALADLVADELGRSPRWPRRAS